MNANTDTTPTTYYGECRACEALVSWKFGQYPTECPYCGHR